MRCFFPLLFAAVLACCVAAEKASPSETNENDTMFGGLITKQCFDTLFVQLNLFDPTCLKKLISKGLGIAIIAGSFGLKIPQILLIVKNKSVEGLAPSSFYLDVMSFAATACYNVLHGYPLSVWGETLVILIQNVLLVGLLWYYSKPQTSFVEVVGATVAFSGIVYAFLFLLPEEHWQTLVWGALASAVMGRLPQIYVNYTNGHTGVVAWQGFFLSFAGALARIFTTMQETGDIQVVMSYVTTASLHFILLAQIVLYRSATAAFLKQSKSD